MKGKSARDKGKKGERFIAELLTRLSGVKYRRTPLSGGLRLEFPFDVLKIGNEPSRFDGVGIEVKNTANLSIPDWIRQIKGECEDAGYASFSSKWCIAFRHKTEWYFLLNQNYFEHLNKN